MPAAAVPSTSCGRLALPSWTLWASVVAAALAYHLSIGINLVPLQGGLDAGFFVSPDSQNYRSISLWLYSDAPFSPALSLRPIGLPLILGIERGFGVGAMVGVHILMWLAIGVLTGMMVRRLTRSEPLSLVVLGLFYLHPSPVGLSYNGLAEISAMFLLSVWCYRAVNSDKFALVRQPRTVLLATLLLGLLTIIKPVYQVHLGLYLGTVMVVGLWHRRLRWRVVGAMALGTTPVLLQLCLMLAFTGVFRISAIGNAAFSGYYLSRVVKRVEGRDSVLEARKMAMGMSKDQAYRYLADHPGVAITTFGYNIVHMNLFQTSLVLRLLPQVNRVGYRFNKYAHYAHPPLFFLFLVFQRRRRDERLLLPFTLVLLSFLTSGLSFWGGDRLVIPAMPLWLVIDAWTLAQLGTFVADRRRMWQFKRAVAAPS